MSASTMGPPTAGISPRASTAGSSNALLPARAVDAQSAATADCASPAAAGVTTLAAFLDEVARVLHAGLPDRVWLAATVVAARASAAGHTLELTDPSPQAGGATLRVFLATSSLTAIRRDLGVSVDPALLVGMTTSVLVAPSFSRRWHLGGRVEAIGRDVIASLRARLLERVIAALKREGVWTRQYSLPLPPDITRLAVIHPAAAAGWSDIAGELGRWERAGLLMVRTHAAAFEGDHAVAALLTALRAASAPIGGHRPDLVLIVRGGGATMSLAVLDEEDLARAILACPVPVLTGTGHAQDRSLADRVAWRAADTPSKALALIGGVIREAARNARVEAEAIRNASTSVLTAEESRLEMRRQIVLTTLSRTHAAAERQISEIRSRLRADLRSLVARLKADAVVLDRRCEGLMARTIPLIDASEQALQRVLQAGAGRAATLLSGTPDGRALRLEIGIRGRSIVERQADLLARHVEAIEAAAARLLEAESFALAHALAAIETVDPGQLLPQGFALVTDVEGRLIQNRAAAAARVRLRIVFADGELSVTPAR